MNEPIEEEQETKNSGDNYDSYGSYITWIGNHQIFSDEELGRLACIVQRSAKETRKLILGTPYAGKRIVEMIDDKSLCARSVIGKIAHKRNLLHNLTEQLYACHREGEAQKAKNLQAKLYHEIKRLEIGTDSMERIMIKIKDDMQRLPLAAVSQETLESPDYLRARITKADEAFRLYYKSVDEIVSKNLKLVISYFKQYRSEEIEFMDLIAIGNPALVRAAKSFKPSKGSIFVNLAYQCFENAFRNAPYIKSKELTILDQRLSSDDPRDYATYRDMIEDDSTVHPIENIKNKVLSPEIERELREALKEKEFNMLIRVLGLNGQEPMTTTELARELGVTRARTNKLYNDALTKLKTPRFRELLELYM